MIEARSRRIDYGWCDPHCIRLSAAAAAESEDDRPREPAAIGVGCGRA
jgi:hypothetical protein